MVAHKLQSRYKLIILITLAIILCILYLGINLKFNNPRLVKFALSIRSPKLIAMLITALAIGSASLIFQSIINNRIVTPCLLGCNSLYLLVHTALVFILGSGHLFVRNANIAFIIDLAIMSVSASFVYGYMFKKTNYNVLYVLLIGTVLTSFFGSIQNTMIRIMDPNEYDALLASLVASFSKVNKPIIIASIILLIALFIVLRKDLKLLDVIALGKNAAINLGVDYDRVIRRLLIGVVLAISIATAMVGPISFLGLIIANLGRQFLKTFRHKQLILATTLFGAIVLIGGQIIVEQVFVYLIPVSVFVTVFGGLYFLYLLLYAKTV